jgi:predicted nucleotidyltransferase
MLSWAIQISVISIILIFLVHNLIQFFKDTLTVPKIKDLVNAPKQKYDDMFFVMNTSNKTNDSKEPDYNFDEIYKQNLLPRQVLEPRQELGNMKNELKNFLKTQTQSQIQNQNRGQTQNIFTLESNKPKIRITDIL